MCYEVCHTKAYMLFYNDHISIKFIAQIQSKFMSDSIVPD